MAGRRLRWLLTIVKWLGIGAVTLLVLVIVGGNIYRLVGRGQLEQRFDLPGRLVSVGAHRMHIHCVGEGEPTVVLEAAGYTNSYYWERVISATEPLTRVCAYDRSGMGWSERGSGTPSAETRLSDLELLLEASGERPPYLMVGASMAASISWQYAQSHLDDVVGLVTVDGMPRDFIEYESLGMNTLDSPVLRLLLWSIDRSGITPLLYQPPTDERMTPEQLSLAEWDRFLDTGIFGEMLSIDSIVESATTMGPLHDLPLIVIVRGQPGTFFDPLGARKDEAERRWPAMQAEMAALSTRSEIRVAENSDHGVVMGEPELVVDAISDLVSAYRAGNGN